jgi:hypothetical protein
MKNRFYFYYGVPFGSGFPLLSFCSYLSKRITASILNAGVRYRRILSSYSGFFYGVGILIGFSEKLRFYPLQFRMVKYWLKDFQQNRKYHSSDALLLEGYEIADAIP